jgi:hypothetical protein
MDFECAGPHEGLRAERALERPLASVPSEVVTQMPMSRKDTATTLIGAGEGLLTIMNAKMCLEIAFLGELFAAAGNRTCKGFDSSMHSQMDLEPTSARVALATELTREGLIA